jgi:thiol-disulfide isomerase/thioredoxin
MRPTKLLLPLVLLATTVHAATALPSADEVLTQAKSQAAAQHKNILLTFSASWCGPCHMFEHFLADPTIRPIVEKAFVTATLDVGERPDDPRHSNSPGAEELRAHLGGSAAGYPYIIMLDPTGKPIVNSFRPDPKSKSGKASIGYPDSPEEIDWFMQMLQKSAPSLNAQDTATINSWLKAHSTQRH